MEEPTSTEDNIPDKHLFAITVADDHFGDIIHFFTMGMAPSEYNMQQNKELVVKATDLSLIIG